MGHHYPDLASRLRLYFLRVSQLTRLPLSGLALFARRKGESLATGLTRSTGVHLNRALVTIRPMRFRDTES